MGVNVFPAASGGASYSSQPPASASSVLLDGQLVTASSISTTVTGTGAPWLLYANGAGTTTITIAGTPYTVTAGSTVGTSAYTGSQSVSVNAIPPTIPTAFSSTTMSFNPGNGWSGIAYGNGLFIACGGNNTSYSYSVNGSTGWTTGTFSAGMSNIVYGNGYWVATGGFVGNSTSTLYSTNGTTWTAGGVLPASRSWFSMAYGAGQYSLMTGNTSSTTCAYSTNNGVSWSTMTMPSAQLWYGIAYGLIGATGYWMAVCATNNTASAYSTNGTTWTATTMGHTDAWTGIAYGNGIFVATNSSSVVNYSTNGTSWNESTNGTTANYVCFGNGFFVAPGNSRNSGYYSVNGNTWTSFTMTASLTWGPITWGNGTYVAVNNAAPGGTIGNYFTQPSSTPVAYGIYNGATVRA